jgi:hypothetical protein
MEFGFYFCHQNLTKMLKKLKKAIFLGLGLLAANQLMAQAPTDNAYRSRYNPNQFHWTDTLHWSQTTDASTITGLLLPGKRVDSTAMHNLMAQISGQGGGVIYFPADTFRFGFDLIIPSGLVLRGATPAIPDALNDNYKPGTVFEFPKYEPSFSGDGTPNNTAFKSIKGKENARNIALVNLDINRAHIGFHPENWTDAPGVNTKWPVDINFNILVFGIRSNNVAIPDPGVPAPASGNDPAQLGWQRYVWRFTSNIGLYVSRNGVVANCRVNDAPTDSYNQPGYILRSATNANCWANGQSKLNPDGSDAKFEYTDHIGIDLNRAKINKDGAGSGTGPNGKYGIYGFVTFARPNQEPQLFAPGNEIRDCYVLKTRRVGIIAAGHGLVVDNNKVRDRLNKIAFIRANGQGCETNNSATHENRGMDVSGWNVTATRNDIEVQQHRIGGPSGYPSVDGEGILVQECCGGTEVKDYNFKFNKLTEASTGYIGLWKMRTMYNVHIDSNDLGCKNIFLTANTNNTDFSIFNSSIKGNTNLNGISSNAGTGGANFDITGNSFCGAGTIIAPGFANISNNGGATVTPGAGNPVVAPTASILSPGNFEVVSPGSLVLIDAQVAGADSIRYYLNTSPISSYSSASNTAFTWTANVPPGTYTIFAQVKNANAEIFSNSITILIPVSVGEKLPSFSLVAFPNPSKGIFQLSFDQKSERVPYVVYDFSGKNVASGQLGSNRQLNVSQLPSGIYHLHLWQGKMFSKFNLVKE